MTRAYLAFTSTGLALARRLADALPGSVDRCGSGGVSLAGWTALQFAQSDALVFVGAVGIAVRAIAPHCRSKASDPAVVVLDECGRFAVPVLSGHLGGANDLARALAAVCGAVPVITTATDAHGIFAVDEWAKHQNCTVLMVTHNMSNINLCDKIAFLGVGGVLCYYGAPENLHRYFDVELTSDIFEKLHDPEQVEYYRRKYFTSPEFNRLVARFPAAAKEAEKRCKA
mgnify:CR=1 FL=1